MILRIPDFYEDFSCIADKCTDSCCIGWEIDIDEDTYEYYYGLEGELGERFRKNVFTTEDGEYGLRLDPRGRCPFLDEKNLCDICSAYGEVALSEVCTEYPRTTIEYGNVMQKCLGLSCVEAGRMVFEKEEPITLVELQMTSAECDEEEDEADISWYHFLEYAQKKTFEILQDRRFTIWERMNHYLEYARKVQDVISEQDLDDPDWNTEQIDYQMVEVDQHMPAEESMDSFEQYQDRIYMLEQMDILNAEWRGVKNELAGQNEEAYLQGMKEWLASGDCVERDYEHLLVYFNYRYLLRTIYDYNFLTRARLAVTYTRIIRDMDALRYRKQNGHYDRADRIDVVRIFSKEMEHSEENYKIAEEEIEFSSF
ncbi:YkgJ family cysteine cluster protein [Roseburia sp. MUC/MUC-530-WT-4D]|uniref:YkgJ family cysteine cluster protein n=1 Tax=Roseburia porci TaxID=2605790 RepID=A0A6L5YRF1_9FIRM|nr:flagellin lysine-N-methylase [Roseburia porci]MST74486.1 YkgJ family cysteine cluster protein [Roseburia porci]